MSDEQIAEREALEELIRTPGWQVYVRAVGREWRGSGYYARMNTVLKSNNPAEAMVVHRCAEEIVTSLLWPERRIAELLLLEKGKK